MDLCAVAVGIFEGNRLAVTVVDDIFRRRKGGRADAHEKGRKDQGRQAAACRTGHSGGFRVAVRKFRNDDEGMLRLAVDDFVNLVHKACSFLFERKNDE